MRQHNPNIANPNQSMAQRIQGRLGATIVFNMQKKVGECTFCY